MAEHHTQKRQVARGCRHGRQRAIAERTSFAEQVRVLIEWGLEAANG